MHFRAAVSAAAAARPATSRGHRRRLLAPLADLRRLLAASRQLLPDTHSPLHPLGPRPLLRAPCSPRRRRPPLPRAAAAPPGPCTCLALPCAAGLPGSLTLGAGKRAEPRGRTRWGAYSQARARAPLRTLAQAPARIAAEEGSPAPAPGRRGCRPRPGLPPSLATQTPVHPTPTPTPPPTRIPPPTESSAWAPPHSRENSAASAHPPPTPTAICPAPLSSPTNDLFPLPGLRSPCSTPPSQQRNLLLLPSYRNRCRDPSPPMRAPKYKRIFSFRT